MNLRSAPRPPSAYDVARLAGVSQSAVSRTFNEGGSVSMKTRNKVLAAAQALDYRPNLLARSLSKGKSKTVGIVLGNTENPFFTLALEQLSRQFSQAGLRLLVFTSSLESEIHSQIDEMLNFRIDALIVLSANLSSSLATQCQKAGISVVFFNRTSNHNDQFCSVTGNNKAGSEKIADLLVKCSYQNIAFIAGNEDSSTSRDREQAFCQRLSEHDYDKPIREIGYFSRDGAMQATRRLLQKKTMPEVIFCANDLMAIAAIDVARYEFGLEIGIDIGVVGFDNIPMSSWPGYRLCTYSQPLDIMSIKACGFVLNNDPELASCHQAIVDGELILRSSVRKQTAE